MIAYVAFEPVPLYLPVVLFDGEHTTTENFTGGEYAPGYGLSLAAEFGVGESVKNRTNFDGKGVIL